MLAWAAVLRGSNALEVFRSYYPKGRTYLLTPSSVPSHVKRFGAHEVTVCNPSEMRP